jgi:DNA-binding transcriptional MerR regulator
MTARSYLSIGDVLTLLRQEFPDITISKIRFLESQGLVDPERTPSGYRKFYQHDVERLRWVLVQQRENFLPLKVIKDRLEDDPESVVAEAAATAARTAADRPEPVLVGRHVANGDDSPSPRALRTADESALPGMDAPVPPVPAARPPAAAERDGEARSTTLPGRATGDGAATVEVVTTAGPASPVAPRGGPQARDRTGPQKRGGAGPAPARATAGETPAREDPAATNAGAAAGRSRSRTPKAASGSGGRSARGGGSRRRTGGGSSGLSADDLAESSGLPVEVVEELGAYGLLAPTMVAGFATYDELDATIAKLAGQLAPFGIEPRHLRLYKNAADREAGFVEQVILPLLRQRNPDARARAETTAEELVSLGQDLRSSLLQRALGGLVHH